MRKFLNLLFTISLVLVFSGALFSCSNDDETSDTTEQTTTTSESASTTELESVDAASMDATIAAQFESADQDAQAWKENATLMMVSVKLPSDLSLNNSTVTYTYGSDDITETWWTYSFSESNSQSVRALVYKEDFLGEDLDALPKSYWRTNYIEAFQMADNYGGADFRANHSGISVNLTLSVSEPKGWLWWLVEYSTASGDQYSVRINPSDRTIVDETGEIITTGSTYSPDTIYSDTITNTTTDNTNSDDIIPTITIAD